jgi:NAD(P) transhydrogenase
LRPAYRRSFDDATGPRNRLRPDSSYNFPFGSPEVYDSDTIVDLDCAPKTLGVIGAGVIGSEYACTFAAPGAEVHLIDGSNVVLPTLDTEVSRALIVAMAQNGIVFHWNERAHTCDVGTDGII